MYSAARAMHLLEMLQQDRSIRVAQAASRLGASASSIRRDLGQPERQGLLTRVYGGAIADGDEGPPAELPLRARASENAEQKRRIGAAAAALIGDGQTVLVPADRPPMRCCRCWAAVPGRPW